MGPITSDGVDPVRCAHGFEALASFATSPSGCTPRIQQVKDRFTNMSCRPQGLPATVNSFVEYGIIRE